MRVLHEIRTAQKAGISIITVIDQDRYLQRELVCQQTTDHRHQHAENCLYLQIDDFIAKGFAFLFAEQASVADRSSLLMWHVEGYRIYK
jgi:hypothetical protein